MTDDWLSVLLPVCGLLYESLVYDIFYLFYETQIKVEIRNL